MLALTGCVAPQYAWSMENDLPHDVIVSGCEDCGDGQQVEPGGTFELRVVPGAAIEVHREDGSLVGCATASDSGSTSDAVPMLASQFAGLACEG